MNKTQYYNSCLCSSPLVPSRFLEPLVPLNPSPREIPSEKKCKPLCFCVVLVLNYWLFETTNARLSMLDTWNCCVKVSQKTRRARRRGFWPSCVQSAVTAALVKGVPCVQPIKQFSTVQQQITIKKKKFQSAFVWERKKNDRVPQSKKGATGRQKKVPCGQKHIAEPDSLLFLLFFKKKK